MTKEQTKLELKKAVVDWLWARKSKPDGLAFDVGMFHKTDHVDVAAAWLKTNAKPAKISGKVFVCCATRADCWPVCSISENIVEEVVALKKMRTDLEAEIRETEPELREDGMLFEELAIWDYEKSSNADYHELCKRVTWLEKMLYEGTTLQHISEHPLCSRMYVVVPEGILQPKELRDDWGLLWVKTDGTISEMRESQKHSYTYDDALLMVRRIMNCNTIARKLFLDLKTKKNK